MTHALPTKTCRFPLVKFHSTECEMDSQDQRGLVDPIAETSISDQVASGWCQGHELDGGTYYVGACEECSNAMPRNWVNRK